MTKRTRVVVVEDSLVQRAHLVRALRADGDIDVIGEATDALEAIAIVQRTQPDVITLDLQIPGGGGQEVIRQLMAVTPTPILVLSASVTDRASVTAVEALVAGAVDVLPKPTRWTPDDEATLRARVRLVSGVAVVRHIGKGSLGRRGAASGSAKAGRGTTVVGIGASTGGPAALAEVLSGLTDLNAAGIIGQHLHPDFVGGLVSWMARATSMPVELATTRTPLRTGVVTIAPGGTHLRIDADDCCILDPKPETLHRPSIDVLFASLADRPRGRNVGVLLTGMGEDGAAGLLQIRTRGGVTIAQDEATSVVFGMPKAAQQMGAAAQVAPIEKIASAIERAVGK